MSVNSSQFWRHLVANAANADTANPATSSVAPVSGEVCLAFIATYKAILPDIPTCSGTNGFNGTWTQVFTVTVGTDLRLTCFSSVATSSVAGVITFACTNTQLAYAYAVIASPFINTTTPVVQSKTATDIGIGTTLSVTLDAALASAVNWVIGAFAQRSVSTIQGDGTGYYPTPVPTATGASDGISLRVVVGSAITVGASIVAASVSKVAGAVEIAQSGIGVIKTINGLALVKTVDGIV